MTDKASSHQDRLVPGETAVDPPLKFHLMVPIRSGRYQRLICVNTNGIKRLRRIGGLAVVLMQVILLTLADPPLTAVQGDVHVLSAHVLLSSGSFYYS